MEVPIDDPPMLDRLVSRCPGGIRRLDAGCGDDGRVVAAALHRRWSMTHTQDVAGAIAVFKQRDFNQARELLEAAREADPELPPARLLLARMFLAAGQPVLARAELERVMQEHPQEPEAFLIAGEIALGDRRYSDADLAFRKSAELTLEAELSEYRKARTTSRTRLGLARIAEQREDWATAAKLLQPIVDEDPNNSDTVLRLARCLIRQSGSQKSAYELLQKHWVYGDAKVQRPEVTMGLLYLEANEIEKSARMMKEAAKRGPTDAATQLSVATWALEQGDFVMAQQCADRAVAASNSSIESRLVMALVARYREDYETAKELLESVHLESPGNLAAVIELAIVLPNIKGMENRGLQYAQLATKLQPNLGNPAGRNAAIALACDFAPVRWSCRRGEDTATGIGRRSHRCRKLVLRR